MKVFVYANCQAIGVAHFLKRLTGESADISFVENYLAIAGSVSVDSFLDRLRAADVFIYQPVGAAHGFLSTIEGHDNVLSQAISAREKVSFPYIYNSALWPCYLAGEAVENGSAIDQMIEAGAEEGDIVRYYDGGLLDFRFRERLRASMEILRRTEASTDVKIHDFIEGLTFQAPTFLTQNHPTSLVFQEVARQIYLRLFRGGKADEFFGRVNVNAAGLPGRYPIDNYMIENLGLTFADAPEPHADKFYKELLVRHLNWVRSGTKP